MKKAGREPLYKFWAPQYWPIWLGLFLLRLICLLPHHVRLGVGAALGRFIYRIAGGRRAITRRNIALAFSELDDAAISDLARRHFEALGMSLIELGLGRWASDDELNSLTDIHGTEHLAGAVANGSGVILLSAHFTTLEISGRVLSLNSPPFDAVYRRHRNALLTELLRTGRERSASATIEKNDIKSMVRSLREGRPVWYAPDQSYNLKQSAVLPFFGVPAMTNTATSSLARLGRAHVLPYFPRRLASGRYELTIMPPLSDFPSGDAEADTRRIVEILEERVRLNPEQYYWIHRKYKNLPDGMPDYYADLDAWK
ncbi:MAG: lipid A biosynthesis lauroyl acyltransferase [Woeseia sp.]|nr:lipid A biosynthesis lauroyl acyltransferase [Woeseia sp.]